MMEAIVSWSVSLKALDVDGNEVTATLAESASAAASVFAELACKAMASELNAWSSSGIPHVDLQLKAWMSCALDRLVRELKQNHAAVPGVTAWLEQKPVVVEVNEIVRDELERPTRMIKRYVALPAG